MKFVVGLLVSVVLILGLVDLDWMVTTWHYDRTVKDYWEFAPNVKFDWWTSYFVTIVRACAGFYLLGFLSALIRQKRG